MRVRVTIEMDYEPSEGAKAFSDKLDQQWACDFDWQSVLDCSRGEIIGAVEVTAAVAGGGHDD